MAAGEAEDQGHWFAGRDLDVLIYRVNRRPLAGDPSLFKRPKSSVRHLSRVLSQPVSARTGRRYQRDWRIGNIAVDMDAHRLTGMLGWSRSGETLTNVWDPGTQSWLDQRVASEASAVAPFAYLSVGHYLGVLRHPSFAEDTIATVFTQLLNSGEREQSVPRVQWAVEPVGNQDEFAAWLSTVDRVSELNFVFRRPNPDGDEAFRDLFARLDRLRAEKIRESITALDPQQGLDRTGLRTDRTTQAFIAAAMAAFGFVVGKGYVQGRRSVYDQRRQALRERIDGVSSDWDGATRDVAKAVRRARRRSRDRT